MATRFDDKILNDVIKHGNPTRKLLRNSSAYDELCGHDNGILILAAEAQIAHIAVSAIDINNLTIAA